jgi:carbon storage regulator CsrA
MLVLSRRIRESVVVLSAGAIDPMLKVTVIESKNGGVRLGFEAQTDVLIHRWEVWQKIQTEGPSTHRKVHSGSPAMIDQDK